MLVTAIIPTYNRAKTIERAVNSVLAQTWKEMEVIVVDDGSNDQTGEVLKAYGDKIRVIHQRNGGPAAARNTGIKAATGEIISFLDSDDAWMPSKIERQVKLLQRTASAGVVCCVCNARMFFSSGTVITFESAGLHPEQEEGIWSNPVDTLMNRFLFFNQVVAVRREALAQSGLFREDLPYGLNDDYDLSLRLSLIGPWSFIAEPLVEWHEHVDNISRTHRHLEICVHTLRILNDINNTPCFRGKLPQARFNRRLRSLNNAICVLRLETGQNPFMRLSGRCLHFCLHAYEALHSRISPAPRMLTHKAEG
jgi:glycosyltransferase involved in cell wall biosynthesis